MEPISISAFIMALISSFVLFIKGIRICKCNKGGFEIERDVNYDIEQQQEYTLKLIKALKNSYTPRKENNKYDKDCKIERDSVEYEKNIKYVNIDDTPKGSGEVRVSEGDKYISELISDLEKEIENNKKNRKINHKKQNSREYIESKLLKITGLYKKNKIPEQVSEDNNNSNDIRLPHIRITDPNFTYTEHTQEYINNVDSENPESKNITQFISKKIK